MLPFQQPNDDRKKHELNSIHSSREGHNSFIVLELFAAAYGSPSLLLTFMCPSPEDEHLYLGQGWSVMIGK